MTKKVAIIISGGRNFNDYKELKKRLDEITFTLKDDCEITIISGGAIGTDNLAIQYAKMKEYKYMSVPARWSTYGEEYAGIIRNNEMINAAITIFGKENVMLVAFWNGESGGTMNAIATAKKYDIGCLVYEETYASYDGIPEEEKIKWYI